MKTNHSKLFIASAALLCAAIMLATLAPRAAFAFEKVQGQDKAGKNCERIDTPGSSTFGKCENVCKDKEVTRDAPNNRWVCKSAKTVKTTPLHDRVTGGVKVLDAGSNPKPKQPATAGAKAGKAKKN
jgi:hypothetical protein